MEANIEPRILNHVRNYVSKYILNHSVSFYGDHQSGAIVGKVNDMANATDRVINSSFYNILPALISGSILVYIFIQKHILYAIIVLLWGGIVFTTRLYFRKKSEYLSQKKAHLHNQWRGLLTDIVQSIWSVKTYTSTKKETQKLNTAQAEEKNAAIQVLMFNSHLISWELFLNTVLCYICLFSVLSWQWINGHNTAGDWILITYGSWMIMGDFRRIISEIPNILDHTGQCQQAIETLFVPIGITDKPNAKKLKVSKGEIEFKNIVFNYSEETSVFKKTSLTIKGGQKLGLVGPSGAGKTSLVNLILRLFDIESGAIMIDGQDIRDVDQESLRKKIAYIPQDPALFHRSLMDNIRYGNPKATKKQVYMAAKKAQIHEFISNLPEGYNTLVGERGVKLSGGQRQRVVIARAILKNAPIVIIDEGTSALDSLTEENVQKTLYSLMEGRTTIVIAHRLSTLKTMDRLLVMKEGKIVQDGTHKKLLKEKDKLYAQLWQRQINGFIVD